MNSNDPAHRSRGPPVAPSASFNQRSAQDGRNGISPEINIVSTTGVSRSAVTVTSPGTLVSRAEKFEDEKRRIIESCFGKREIDGSSTSRAAFVILGGGGPCSKAFRLVYKLMISLFLSFRIIHYPHPNSRRCCASIDPATGAIAAGEQKTSSHCDRSS